jgi:hypothetical protein
MKFDVFLEDEKYEYKIRNRLKCYDWLSNYSASRAD